MRTLVAASAGLFLIGALGQGRAADTMAQQTINSTCQKCHGASGDSDTPIYPRLNGQQADYIAAQLKNFRDHKRDDTHARGYMWGKARTLDDQTIAALAQHYAGQKPTPPQSGGALAAEGEALYQHGDPGRGVMACQQCHGHAGEGAGAMPRVAGQHAPYLRMVLGAFRSGLRRNDQMNGAAKNLSDHQIEALSSYLAND
jgi:cytochrome c553